MDRAGFRDWLQRYVDAWRLNDAVAIGDLFSADVRYAFDPFGEAVVGRNAVIEAWLDDPDEPGSWQADYEVLAEGVAASPGAAKGAIVFTAEDAVAAAEEGRDVILVRPFTEADDVAALIHAHPTQNEAFGEAHLALAGKPLHSHS